MEPAPNARSAQNMTGPSKGEMWFLFVFHLFLGLVVLLCTIFLPAPTFEGTAQTRIIGKATSTAAFGPPVHHFIQVRLDGKSVQVPVTPAQYDRLAENDTVTIRYRQCRGEITDVALVDP